MIAPPPADLRRLVEAALAEAGVPGCSITVVTASGPLWSGGFGFADLRSRRRATADTVYHLFSATKLFTAVAVLQLMERGFFRFEDPVQQFIPEAKTPHPITLHHLLTHRSGLKDTLRAFLSVSFPPAEPPTSAAALSRYRIAPARPPGERVEYRNVNYALLGEVVRRVSGMEYPEYVGRHILAPLGMRAGFVPTEETPPQAATGYMRRLDPMRVALRLLLPSVPRRLYGERVGGLIELKEYTLNTAAVGGLIGSMPEFSRFLQAQLAGDGGVLSAEATRLMQTLVAEGEPGIESRVGIGLGWKFGRVGERLFLNHEGGGAGFTSELRLYPEAGIGIALAMNLMQMPRTMRVAHRICEALLAA